MRRKLRSTWARRAVITAGASFAMPRAAGVPMAGGTSRATPSAARYA
jgi:hypothetical protein